ncbi:MAG: YeeE/YedE family protein [Bacteroidia bacterium]|nr:YeeE/YedE family protein [Bacteroidia bacterium]
MEKELLKASSDIRRQDAMCLNESEMDHAWYHKLKYVAAGVLLSIIFIKAEILSWYRIQEMFCLKSFHMYGIIGSAVAVGALSVWLIKKFNIKTLYGEPIKISKKEFNYGVMFGGFLFGIGWALTGSCPGPMYALVGMGNGGYLVVLASAVLGTWCYGKMRDRLPH